MSFYSRTHCPLFVHDYNLLKEEIFFDTPFRFCIYKSGIMGCTYGSIRMDQLGEDYDEEFDRVRESFRYWQIDNDLISLRLDTIRFAHEWSLKNK